MYCVMGTIAQIAHCYFLLESISSLDGGWKTFQATLLSIFISSSLLYFVAIADKDENELDDQKIKEQNKIAFAITLFTIIEILINIYYYSRHLLIDQEKYQIFDFIFAILVSCLIPITIKLYSSSIRAKEWILDIENNRDALVSQIENSENSENISINEEQVLELIKPLIDNFQDELKTISNINQEKIDELINVKLVNLNNDIDSQIAKSYEKNQGLFLSQFENKLKMLSKEYLDKLKTL